MWDKFDYTNTQQEISIFLKKSDSPKSNNEVIEWLNAGYRENKSSNGNVYDTDNYLLWWVGYPFKPGQLTTRRMCS